MYIKKERKKEISKRKKERNRNWSKRKKVRRREKRWGERGLTPAVKVQRK